jgi:hypothetical protein
MKVLVPNYTFNASAKTVTFNSYGSISLENVLLITNASRGTIIYSFADPSLTGTVSGNILTLTYNTTSMSNSDKLQVFYDDPTASQKIDGSGSTQPVSGTVTVANLPGTQPISGAVSVSNLPSTQPISGSVSVSNLPSTQPISGAVSVSGSVSVSNLPATQPISGTVTVQQPTATSLKVDLSGTAANSTAIKVDNSGVTQPISGSVSVSNLPATQPVSGSVSVSNLPTTQAVSAASLPLPTGAATSAKQPALGTVGTASADVLTTQQGYTQATYSAVNPGVNQVLLASTDVTGYKTISVQVTGANPSSLTTWQISNDNTNWLGVLANNASATGNLTTVNVLNTGVVGIFVIPVSFRYFRIINPSSQTFTASATVEFFTHASSVLNTNTYVQSFTPFAVTATNATASNLKVDISGTAANANAIKVDGSAVTQPVSIGSTVTTTVSGSVTLTSNSSFNSAQVAINTGPATLIIGSNPLRHGFAIRNAGANSVYIGASAGVSSGSGFEITAGTTFTVNTNAATGTIYGITGSSISNVSMFEW